MNYVLLTEGTGQGGADKSNVSHLAASLVKDDCQRVHLKHGCGAEDGIFGRLLGSDAVDILLSHYEWLSQQGAFRMKEANIFIFGFSRGALIARALANLLCRTGIAVDAYDARRVFKYHRAKYSEAIKAFRREKRLSEPVKVKYLGLWDTVDSTIGIDGENHGKLPVGVESARHAVARDERRRFFKPLLCEGAEELVFPGTHSDIGGTYEDNHVIADLTLAWVAEKAVEMGLRLKNEVRFPADADISRAVIHDSLDESNNAWGKLEPVKRSLAGVKEHISCSLL